MPIAEAEEKTKQRSLSFDEETWRRLGELAMATGRSRSQVLRILVWNVRGLADLEPRDAAERVKEVAR